MVAAEESALEHPFHVDRQPPAPAGVLVWCFEGCMKPEQSQKRKELQSIAERCGRKCFFHKKAVTFLRWLEGKTQGVVLIADWREVKPIEEGIAGRRKDVHMYIMARSANSYLKARSWVHDHGRFKQISMLEDLSPEHVQELAQRHFTMKPIREDPQTSYQWTTFVKPGPLPPRVNGEPLEVTSWLSYASLVSALQDPQKAAVVEQVLKQMMLETQNETYED